METKKFKEAQSMYVVDNLDLRRSDFVENYLRVVKDPTVKRRSNITKPKNRKKKNKQRR